MRLSTLRSGETTSHWKRALDFGMAVASKTDVSERKQDLHRKTEMNHRGDLEHGRSQHARDENRTVIEPGLKTSNIVLTRKKCTFMLSSQISEGIKL